MRRVKYICKNCGWNDSLPVLWSDIKPKRCMNKKCNTNFVKEPDKLNIIMPPKEDQGAEIVEKKSKKGSKSK